MYGSVFMMICKAFFFWISSVLISSYVFELIDTRLKKLTFWIYSVIILSSKSIMERERLFRFEIQCCECGRSKTIFDTENEVSIEKCEACGCRHYNVKMVTYKTMKIRSHRKTNLKSKKKFNPFLLISSGRLRVNTIEERHRLTGNSFLSGKMTSYAAVITFKSNVKWCQCSDFFRSKQ